jgi:hypothetical protein
MRTFNFPIGVLVAAGQLGWLNCKKNQPDFESLRAVYTLLYIQGKLDGLTALSRLPDEFQRSVMHENLRVDLLNKAAVSLKFWRKLRRYVMNGYPPEKRNLMLKDMGRGYLTEALNDNFTALQELLTKGSTFIETNESKLLENDNMPASFMADYNTNALETFMNAKKAFYESEEYSETLTITVNNTANACYDELILMLDDGKAIYDGNEEMKRLFTLDYLLGIVTPTGPAGLKGTVKENGAPAAGIIVELENRKLSVIPDAEGAFSFGEKLASGKDRMIVKRGDQILFESEVDIPPGITVTEHVNLGN